MAPRIWSPVLLATVLGSCNTAPVLPPDDVRVIELVETNLWSGGEVRAVVRHAEVEEEPVAITLDGEALTVTRVDDTTFAAALPVHTGALPIRVEREGLGAIESGVTLHGYLSGMIGPMIGGPVVGPPGAGALVVLGSTNTGAAEVSLETGVVVRSWPLDVHSLKCGVGVVPGPAAGQVLLRPSVNGICQSVGIHSYSATGLGPVLGTLPRALDGVAAIVGPWTYVLGRHDNDGIFSRCAADPPWSGCQPVMGDVAFNSNIRGWVAGYQAQRIFALGLRTALHDLTTGDVVRILPHVDAEVIYYHSAAFSPSEDSLYVAAFRFAANDGKLLLLDSGTGITIEEIEFNDGHPLAVTLDPGHDRILLLMHNRPERRLWLRVLDATTHDLLAELPAPAGEIEAAVWENEHHRLVLDAGGSRVFVVSTRYQHPSSNGDVEGMAIARWTLIPE